MSVFGFYGIGLEESELFLFAAVPQRRLVDEGGAAAVCFSLFADWFILSVRLSVRVESGIVADIEVDSLLPSDCDTFYQIKSQPISIR